MTDDRRILEELAAGKITIEEAERRLRLTSVVTLEGLATLDANRDARSGVPEVVMAETKTSQEIERIIAKMLESQGFALLTRMDEQKLKHIESSFRSTNVVRYGREPLMTVLVHSEDWTPKKTGAKIALVTAGTSDIPYAEEAKAIAYVMGVDALAFYDVGVAGIHRLIQPLKQILENDVEAVVVFAGMEGALPTVVAALVDIPVIGVPVPVGYGHGGDGETALASMLQSCAPGLAVVNIGNGFGGGAMASIIALRTARNRRRQD